MTLQKNVSTNRIAHLPGDQGVWSKIRHKVETKKPTTSAKPNLQKSKKIFRF